MTFEARQLDYLKPELGSAVIEDGTYFAVYSEHAERVELCLYDDQGRNETARIDLARSEGGIWRIFVRGVTAGAVYGYRVHGPYRPEEGHRFNPNKLLLDPYARQIAGALTWDDAVYGYRIGDAQADLSFDERDSAAFVPKAVVQDVAFDWSGDHALRRPWTETVIYECHVKGLTMLHPLVPDDLKGSFRGLASEPVIRHLKQLGITAIELLPSQFFIDDRHLLEKGLSNFWGYQTLGFFAPEPRFLSGRPPSDFKEMVRAFHAAGIEVIMDVVYNHTAEGNELGPTLSFRGLDNLSYYRAAPDAPRHCFDQTGTGNTLNVAHPMVLRMVMDSLRYWVEAMHVDGFRFDLGATLGREAEGFDRNGGFFDAIRQDPILSGVKLIAEPWDIGEGGYQVGGFPPPFREWNDKFRNDVRRFWRGDSGMVPKFTSRLLGSPVQFDHSARLATSSVNFLTAHDGFTLMDVASYNDRHNEANGEDGRDGHENNLSGNMGVEGPTDDRAIVAARARRRRAMMASLLLSQGVPMILGGDEIGNSQQGNNNTYAQDNETGWVNWAEADEDFQRFCEGLIRLRKAHPALCQEHFLGKSGGADFYDLAWYQPDGRPMDNDVWNEPELKVIIMYVAKASDDGVEAGDEMILVFNAGGESPAQIPEPLRERSWRMVLDSGSGDTPANPPEIGTDFTVPPVSVMALVPA